MACTKSLARPPQCPPSEWNDRWLEPEYWAAVKDIPHKELWALRKALPRLIEGVRARLERNVLEDALTIGFFASLCSLQKRGLDLFRSRSPSQDPSIGRSAYFRRKSIQQILWKFSPQ